MNIKCIGCPDVGYTMGDWACGACPGYEALQALQKEIESKPKLRNRKPRLKIVVSYGKRVA